MTVRRAVVTGLGIVSPVGIGSEATWDALVAWTADLTGAFLRAQVEAGASAVQLFDSWAGSLSLADYTSRVAPSSTRALAHVADAGVPATCRSRSSTGRSRS